MSNQSHASQQGTNQNVQRPSHPNGYDHGPYQPVPHQNAPGNATSYKSMPNQSSDPRTNGPYMPIPNPNAYQSQNPSYQGQNGHNTGSLNNKMKQAMRPSPSVYQQNPTKNQRPQGVYQQDLALPEYNPPPPAPGSQKSDNGVYQKVPEAQRNGSETGFPPYQKVPNLHEGPHSRIPPNTTRQDPYQRVPNPNPSENGTYQRIPNPNTSDNGTYQRLPNPSENGPYQRVPNPQDSYQRLPHDPYQRVPHTQDLNQRGTPPSQDPYQRVPNPNEQFQRGANPNDQYQRIPYPESNNQRQDPYQRVPNPARGPYQGIPNSADHQGGNYPRPGVNGDANSSYQRIPNAADPNYQRLPPSNNPTGPYQRVPNTQDPHQRPPNTDLPDSSSYSPYQHPPVPRNVPEKSALRPTNSSGGVCNLCRKKSISSPAVYCADCDFYMSRFKPKTSGS
ncbi:early nodulin-75-like [Diaphorina citri]|uniref:Early nodulin-75-like n=2 Tax=Diaphorina citri TaxID=121845 RepID=A0A3Q0JBP9_DIACI|nr:early nodulin-75-like [Diaphorina citri]